MPVGTDSLVFNAAAANNRYSITLGANRTAAGITFSSATGTNAFTFNAGNTLTLNAGGLTNNDAQTQAFNSAIIVNTAQTWNAAAGGFTTNAVTLGANLTLSGTGPFSFGSGTGSLVNSAGNRTFTNNATGLVTIDTVSLSNDATGRTLTIAGTGDTTVTGAIANGGTSAGNLVKDGTGTLTLSVASSYTGTTTLNDGVLSLSAGNFLGATPGAPVANKLIFNGGTLNSTANTTIHYNRGVTINAGGGTIEVNSGTVLSYAGIMTGAGTFNKTGLGTFTFDGANTNTHYGDINVNAGTMQIARTVADSAIGDSAAVTVAAGATLAFNGGVGETVGSIAGAGVIDNINASAITLTTGGNNASTTFAGVIQDTGGNLSLVKTGSGILTLSGANGFTGTTTVNSGTLLLGASNVLSNSTAVTVASGATLDVNGQADTIASLAGAGTVDFGSGTLITAGNASTTFSGAFTGPGTFTKQGTGILTIDTDLTFNGTFNLAGGTLRLSDIMLDLDTLNITGNSTIDFSGVNAALYATNLNISTGVTLSIINWSNAVDFFYAANWAGATPNTRGTAPMNQVTFNGFSAANTQWQGYDDQVTPVPEPSTYGALLLGALTGLFAWRRRRV